MSSHIHSLLHETGHVIIPGVGGFVTDVSLPQIDSRTGRISAPTETVTFNQEMKCNDGILIQSYMSRDKLSYNAARRIVEREAAHILDQLNEGDKVTIDGLGCLSMNIRGDITFTATQQFANLSSLGLSRLEMPLVSDLKKKIEKENKAVKLKETIRHKKKTVWRYTQYAAACIVALIIYFSFSEPIDNYELRRHENYASIFPTNVILSATEMTRDVEVIAETVNEAKSQATPDEVKPEPSKPAKTVGKTGRYCIIVASLSKGTDPASTIASFVKDGYTNTFAIESNERTRICIEAYDTMQEAVARLKTVTEAPGYANAWILKR